MVIRNRGQRPVTRGRAIIRPPYNYVVYTWGGHREQLYDLDDDPGERRNLAVESRFHETLDEMRALLASRPETWWSLEWERQWHPELAELPDALDGALTWYRATVSSGERR